MPSAVPKRRVLYAGCAGSGRRTSLACLCDIKVSDEKLSVRWAEGARARDLEIRVFDLPTLGTAPGVVASDAQAGWRERQQAFMAELDGIVFVVDPRRDRLDASDAELGRLDQALRHLALDPTTMPLVFQLNKLDLPLDGHGAAAFADITGWLGEPGVLVRAPIAVLRQRFRWAGCQHVETMAAAGVAVHRPIEALMALCDRRGARRSAR